MLGSYSAAMRASNYSNYIKGHVFIIYGYTCLFIILIEELIRHFCIIYFRYIYIVIYMIFLLEKLLFYVLIIFYYLIYDVFLSLLKWRGWGYNYINLMFLQYLYKIYLIFEIFIYSETSLLNILGTSSFLLYHRFLY